MVGSPPVEQDFDENGLRLGQLTWWKIVMIMVMTMTMMMVMMLIIMALHREIFLCVIPTGLKQPINVEINLDVGGK